MIASRKWTVWLAALLFVAIASTAAAPAAQAAPFELSVTYKAAFDKMTAGADKTTAATLKQLYSDLLTSEKQAAAWDTKINALHAGNTQTESDTRAKIKEVDAAKLAKLKAEADKTRAKYEELFALYDSLSSQLRIAKSLDSKAAVAILQPQVDVLKASVALAKEDIRGKDAAYKAAKTAASKKIASLKATLEGVEKHEAGIKTAKSTIGTVKKLFNAETKTVKDALKKGDTGRTRDSLARLLAYSKQIVEQKSKIYGFEQQIAAVIANTNKQIG